MPADTKKKLKKIKTLNIVNKILDFNGQNQQGKGLRILTPNQMLSRLLISLAQLKPGNNSEKLEIRQLMYFCTDQKNLQETSIKVSLKLFKTWKQSL